MIATVLGLDTDKDEHRTVAQALVGVGLGELLPHNHLRLHPALGPALDRELSDEERSAARRAWVEAMVQLTSFLYQQQSQDAQLSATLTILELPNLVAVLEHLRRDSPAETTVGVRRAHQARAFRRRPAGDPAGDRVRQAFRAGLGIRRCRRSRRSSTTLPSS